MYIHKWPSPLLPLSRTRACPRATQSLTKQWHINIYMYSLVLGFVSFVNGPSHSVYIVYMNTDRRESIPVN